MCSQKDYEDLIEKLRAELAMAIDAAEKGDEARKNAMAMDMWINDLKTENTELKQLTAVLRAEKAELKEMKTLTFVEPGTAYVEKPMTRRDMFAMAALAGTMACSEEVAKPDWVARQCVDVVDALLAELDKKEEGK